MRMILFTFCIAVFTYENDYIYYCYLSYCRLYKWEWSYSLYLLTFALFTFSIAVFTYENDNIFYCYLLHCSLYIWEWLYLSLPFALQSLHMRMIIFIITFCIAVFTYENDYIYHYLLHCSLYIWEWLYLSLLPFALQSLQISRSSGMPLRLQAEVNKQ